MDRYYVLEILGISAIACFGFICHKRARNGSSSATRRTLISISALIVPRQKRRWAWFFRKFWIFRVIFKFFFGKYLKEE